ncbi:MAG: methyl-accepting chemotaxis protein [Chloroflexota bacterium]|nr:methyl-accepting chemotaxis protein [Chloroflexota bacterium]
MTQLSDNQLSKDQRKAHLLKFLLLGSGIFVLTGSVVTNIFSLAPILYYIQTVILVILGVAYVLLRRGYVNISALIFLTSWVGIISGALLLPSLPPSSFLLIPMLLLPATAAASMLFEPYSSFVCATTTTILILTAIAIRGGWEAANWPETTRNEVVYLSIPFITNYVLAVLSWMFGRNILKATQQSTEISQALSAQLTANEALIADVIEVATRLAPMSEQLAATMEEFSIGLDEIAGTSGQMAVGAGSQARQAEAASQAMSQLADATIQINADVQEAGQASAQVQAVTQDSAQVIRALGDKLGNITQIVTMVDKIADQTNLLALNASIEAARAGEAGAGFAVVADEVRRLAEHSANSVSEIGTLSKEISASLENVLATTEVLQTGTSNTLSLTQRVEATTEQQEKASGEMVNAINEIASVAEENAAATEEIAASIEEQVASIEQVANSSQSLSEIANGLQDIVSHFTTNAETICPNLASCPIFKKLTAKDATHRYIQMYCKGKFDQCARKKLKDAGEPVPLSLLPDGEEDE